MYLHCDEIDFNKSKEDFKSWCSWLYVHKHDFFCKSSEITPVVENPDASNVLNPIHLFNENKCLHLYDIFSFLEFIS